MIKFCIILLILSFNATTITAMDENPMQTRSMTTLYREQKNELLRANKIFACAFGTDQEISDQQHRAIKDAIEINKSTALLGVELSAINFAFCGLLCAAKYCNFEVPSLITLIVGAGGCVGLEQSRRYYAKARHLCNIDKELSTIEKDMPGLKIN